MKKYIAILTAVLLCTGITYIMMAQNDNNKDRTAAATGGLRSLGNLADAQTEKTTGVSAEKLKAATLGQPIPLSYINAAQLQKADSVGSLNTYLLPGNEFFYPVISDGVVIASIEVVQNKAGKWVVGQMGGFNTARALSAITEQQLKNDSGVVKNTIRLVHSGAHGLLFVSFQKGGQQWMAPVNARNDVGFRGGEILPEKTVLQKLRDIYKQVDLNVPD